MDEYTVEDMLKDLEDEDEEVRSNAASELGDAMAVKPTKFCKFPSPR